MLHLDILYLNFCLKNLLAEFGFKPKSPMVMHRDILSANYIAKNPMFHNCTKYIEVDCNLV